VIPGANHFFENKTEDLNRIVGGYLDMRMIKAAEDRKSGKDRSKEAERDRLREKELAEQPVADLSDDGDDD
jgi:uncharacterized protein